MHEDSKTTSPFEHGNEYTQSAEDEVALIFIVIELFLRERDHLEIIDFV